jgi:hypothetical protein
MLEEYKEIRIEPMNKRTYNAADIKAEYADA